MALVLLPLPLGRWAGGGTYTATLHSAYLFIRLAMTRLPVSPALTHHTLSRWSLNSAPTWEYPPLAIANQYYDQQADEVKRARYRLILVRGSDLRWLNRERFQEVQAGLRAQHKWLPEQNLPFSEVVLYAYAADRTHSPTYVCLPSGLYNARTGHIVAQTGPEQEILSLPGIYFFDGWRLHPKLPIPDHLPRAKGASPRYRSRGTCT